jgi:hypothetical protein
MEYKIRYASTSTKEAKQVVLVLKEIINQLETKLNSGFLLSENMTMLLGHSHEFLTYLESNEKIQQSIFHIMKSMYDDIMHELEQEESPFHLN